jgi:hypothetical protein
LTACRITVGPFNQEFWFLWDGARSAERVYRGKGSFRLDDKGFEITGGELSGRIAFHAVDSFEVLTHDDRAYTWTRKTLINAAGSIRIGGREISVDSTGLIDESAGYHPRHTHYKWSAGAGRDTQGRAIAWNLVTGINDNEAANENTVWIDGVAQQTGLVKIDDGLGSVDLADGSRLSFYPVAEKAVRSNLIIVRSNYRHPIGRVSGTLAGGVTLKSAFGVMENHDVHW